MIIKRVPNTAADVANLPDFGSWLRTAREECGLTQTDIAGLLDVTPTAVSLWETGMRQVEANRLYQYALICNTQFKLGEEVGAEQTTKL